jgi:tetratricopeptide (TPR) repeat protein
MAQIPLSRAEEVSILSVALPVRTRIAVARGAPEQARAVLDGHLEVRDTRDRQDRGSYRMSEALLLRAEGRPAEALASAEAARADFLSIAHEHYAHECLVEAVEAALELDDIARAEALIGEAEALPPIARRTMLDHQLLRLRALVAGRRGAAGGEAELAEAARGFRELGMRFWLAVALLELAEALRADGRTAEAEQPLDEARAIFSELEARPWLERAGRAAAPLAARAG